MNTNESESFEELRIDQCAADWVAKKLNGFTPKEQDQFFEWLAADPRHSEWYARHMKTWNKLDLLVQWKPEHSQKPNPDLLKSRKTQHRWAWIGGMAALFIFGMFLLTSGILTSQDAESDLPQNLVANNYESHALPDGSLVEMNRGAALKIHYSPKMRRVELVSSEAHFKVAKDESRPFVVRVRGVDFRAVGTAFNVRLTDDTVELLVTEGRVQMGTFQATQDANLPVEYKYTEEVAAGQMSVASLDDSTLPPKVVDVTIQQMDSLLAWKPTLMDFDEVPLSIVVQEFNRRNSIQLKIDDADLEGTPVVASFRSPNVEHFVNLLELTMGVQAERVGDKLIILRRE